MNIEPAMFQRICAAPDSEGNPRRLYAIYGTDGCLLASIDYEHFGQPKWFDDLVELPAVSLSVDEYQRWLRKCLPPPTRPSWRERRQARRQQRVDRTGEPAQRPTLAGR